MRIKSLIVSCLLLLPMLATAAPSKQLWPRWQVNNPLSTQTINNQAWHNFLTKYLTTNTQNVNLLNYAKVTPQDKKSLLNYIHDLSQQHIDNYQRPVQEAYWINLYNALTVMVVLNHYPTKSIRTINLSSGLFSRGPWDKKLITVEGVALSLNDIEHRILRPIWNDPRIHYAVNCASYSCPNLQKQPFTGRNIDRQLDHAAKQYINSPRAVSINHGQLRLSSIYQWYRSDFGGTDQDILQHLKIFARPSLRQQLDQIHHITSYHYNWSLNQVPTSSHD